MIIFIYSPANAQDTDQDTDELPTEPATESQASSTADTSDAWNWDSFEVNDTPLTSEEAAKQTAPAAPTRRLTIEEVTAPDLEAEPHEVYALFQNIPSFEVIPSKIDAEMHPCSNCHQWVKSNTTPRKLDVPHTNFELKHGLHGKGQFWCFSCHNADGSGSLKTLDGEPVEFRDAYIICSQCHVVQARDWAFGAHGKRLSNWQGKRQIYNCTACHYQHSPAFKQRDAMEGPKIRMGLKRPAHWTASESGETTADEPNPPWGKPHE